MNLFWAGIISYLLGAIPTALVVVYILSGRDVRSGGSGNMGAMNTVRMLKKYKGLPYAAAGFLTVWIMDMAKAVVASVIAIRLNPDFSLALTVATIGVILGHNYPVFLKFKGGRGAASFMGILLYYRPVAFILWIVTIFVFMLVFECIFAVIQKKHLSVRLIFHAISEQILGRLTGELVAVYSVYAVDHRLLYPALCGTALIIISHHKRLRDQLHHMAR